ncbi:hypothetical protein JD844_018901 [Phrynosoma platyrhinos]|uniref:Breast carcinoma amplified sequence 1 n=1 Tax=Phrynosoma platyrhinos TaxID=52577 RepID=A0ABQ7SP90_PHRPL|nr:hypothetical protein JD844_018901 [Phrynosoma platyrhinos]
MVKDLGVLVNIWKGKIMKLFHTMEKMALSLLQTKDVTDESNQKTLQQGSADVNCLAYVDTAQEEVKSDNVKTATGTDTNNSIMSFFNKLVSPSKTDSKGDSEDKGSQTSPGGQVPEKTAADSLKKSPKKKKPDSPRLGHNTFSKLFRHKQIALNNAYLPLSVKQKTGCRFVPDNLFSSASVCFIPGLLLGMQQVKKDAQQTEDTKITEQPATTTTIVKTEIIIPPPQENLAAKQTTKAPEPPVQQPATATVVITNETPKEVTKERSSSTPTPLSKFFRKKTPTDDIEVINTEKIESSPEVPAKEENRSQDAAEAKSKGDEKPAKTNLRKFFKLTLDFTDRPLTQAENKEPAMSERSQTSSTENLSKQEGNKQEAKDQQDTMEQETSETASLPNGGDGTKENTPKRIEKRQSFGGFFKGLSPKRMSDAEVQTDPVSIVPYMKPK